MDVQAGCPQFDAPLNARDTLSPSRSNHRAPLQAGTNKSLLFHLDEKEKHPSQPKRCREVIFYLKKCLHVGWICHQTGVIEANRNVLCPAQIEKKEREEERESKSRCHLFNE
jgi:hypothetical protein